MQSERKVLIYLLNAYGFVARKPKIIEREKNYSKYVLSEGAFYNKYYCLHYILLFRLHSKYFKVYFRSVILTSITNTI